MTSSFNPIIQSYLDKDFDLDRLKTQLSLVSNMIRTAYSENPITKVTNVRTICEAMNMSYLQRNA